jgi:major membrane immunogen (membrane-anchored lipoprotein)
MIFFSLTSCSLIFNQQKQNYGSQQIIKNSYKNGIYTEEGDKWKYGNENATVIINNGKVTGVTLRKLDKIGKEVDYEKWVGKKINGSINPNLNKYRIDIAQKMLEEQTYDVESISGATISSENWKRAVHRALDKASR